LLSDESFTLSFHLILVLHDKNLCTFYEWKKHIVDERNTLLANYGIIQ